MGSLAPVTTVVRRPAASDAHGDPLVVKSLRAVVVEDGAWVARPSCTDRVTPSAPGVTAQWSGSSPMRMAAATAAVRLRAPSRSKTSWQCALMVRSVTPSLTAISGLVSPSCR